MTARSPQQAEALASLRAGATVAQVARDFDVTRQIVMWIRDAAATGATQ